LKTIYLNEDIQQQLDDQMQKGYTCSMSGDSKAAVDIWIELWKSILDAMNTYNIGT
jgi:hypothetical protein